MIRKFSIFIIAAAAILSSGCHASKEEASFDTGDSGIEKGTDPVSQINAESDLFLLAFNELGWSRRSSELAASGLDRDVQDGCVRYRKLSGARFAAAEFSCTADVAIGGNSLTHTRILMGREEYVKDGLVVRMTSNFDQRLNLISDNRLVGKGALSRSLVLNIPPRETASNRFKGSYRSEYAGAVAVGSNRAGESWSNTVEPHWEFSRALGESLLANSKSVLRYRAERVRADKTPPVQLALTAQSDIAFHSASGCLRPVGTFAWTLTENGTARSGTLTTTTAGYAFAAEGPVTPWGPRCLEK